MAKQIVRAHQRRIERRWKSIPSYKRTIRKRSGVGKTYRIPIKFKPRIVKFKPRKAIRDRFTGEIVGYK